MIIDGVFKSMPEQVEEYSNLLKKLIHKNAFGGKIYFFFNYYNYLVYENVFYVTLRSCNSNVLLCT